jgi:hypothetical protein
MVRATPVGLFVVVWALLLGGCGGGSGLSNSGACAPPSGVQTVLVYPEPGSTGIPDNFGLVVLGSTAALPPTYQAHVVSSTRQDALLFDGMSAPPNPLPMPNTPPAFANPVYQASLNPSHTFAAGTTITVYLNNETGSSYCLATLNLGSFVVR